MNEQVRAIEEVAGAVWSLLARQKFKGGQKFRTTNDGPFLDATTLRPGNYLVKVGLYDPEGRVLMHYNIPIRVSVVTPKAYSNAEVDWGVGEEGDKK
jgi:hypothetical protein